jgi:cytochrome c-type biogenesis protein CcmE
MLFFNRPSALIAAAALLAISATACGQAAKSSTPTALTASPSDFDGQSVSVSGTAKSPATRKTRRGQMLTFQLCDTQCVSVVEFRGADATAPDATVAEGSTQSVTGTFHASFGRMRRMTNVIVVGGRPGGGGGAGGAAAGGGNAGGATNAGSDSTNSATNASSDSSNSATNAAAPEASPT